MTIDPKLVDELLVNYQKPEDIIGENGLLKQLTKALLERALSAELTEHVGYDKHDPAGYNSGNSRNGSSKKKLKGEFGEIELETPRDRNGSFEPAIVSKGQTRFTGFDDKIISMYSRGMTTREIEGHLKEMYSFTGMGRRRLMRERRGLAVTVRKDKKRARNMKYSFLITGRTNSVLFNYNRMFVPGSRTESAK